MFGPYPQTALCAGGLDIGARGWYMYVCMMDGICMYYVCEIMYGTLIHDGWYMYVWNADVPQAGSAAEADV